MVENVKLEKTFVKVPKAVKGKPAPVAPRPYLENSQKLADQFRVTYDNEVQLRE